ncbi:hypothetical protein SAMN05444396_1081, partial [Flavobacterium segetis]
MSTLNKLIVFFFIIFVFVPKGYSQNADPAIGILMSPSSLSKDASGILTVTVGNYGNATIVSNSLRVTISVGANAEILGIAAGSDIRWSQFNLTIGSANTIQLTNTDGGFGSFDLKDIFLTVRGNAVSSADNILGNIVYIAGSNPLLCEGCASPPLNTSQGNASNSNDNSQTSVAVSCYKPAEPEKVNCWDTFVFNTNTCAWDNIGVQATQPEKVNCWDNFVFNTNTCAWDNTGVQAVKPEKVNCWDNFVFNTNTCAWDNMGVQATQPEKVNCWDNFVFNRNTCAWDNMGVQASKPAKVNCWDTFVFNTNTCAWDNTGVQAVKPEKVNCWDTFVFNTNTCAWDNIGVQATQPEKVNCWDNFVFNTNTCAWDNMGVQAVKPAKVNCWDNFVFNRNTCAWDNTGVQATQPE